MTAVPDIQDFEPVHASAVPVRPVRPFVVQETYWGYIIRANERAPLWLVGSQMAAGVVGLVLAVLSLGLCAVPTEGLDDLLLIKLGASIPMAGMAVLLMWYASRGTQIEVQIDMNLGEVREVLRNRAGRSTLLGLYGFDSIGGVYLERRPQLGRGQAQLVLRYKNTPQVLRVSKGPEQMLEALRDRLGRDLMVRRSRVRQVVREPVSGLV